MLDDRTAGSSASPAACGSRPPGLVARLPISMVGLGIVLLVEAATGSYGLAGAVSAVYVVANAVFAIVQGRLLDRLGQARVLVPVVAVFAARGRRCSWSRSQADWPRCDVVRCWPRSAAPRCPRSAPASGPAGPTCCADGRQTCRPRSPSRRSSTRASSCSGRSW